jgi:hypothetical protein
MYSLSLILAISIQAQETSTDITETLPTIEETIEPQTQDTLLDTPSIQQQITPDSGIVEEIENNAVEKDSNEEIEKSETEASEKESSDRIHRVGLGLNIGIQFFNPKEINQLLEDMFDDMKGNMIIINEYGTSNFYMTSPFKIKLLIYPVQFLAIEPYAQFAYGPKILTINDNSAFLNYFDISLGVNIWAKFNPQKRVSFKLGAGGFVCHNRIAIKGDLGDMTLSGNGSGFNALAGLDINLRKTTVNIDFIVPVGISTIKNRDGSLSLEEDSYTAFRATNQYSYPRKINLIGFQFRPGVTFLF